MPKPKKELAPITFAGASIRLYPRPDGRVKLCWHEGGKKRDTTRPDLKSAEEFAKTKVRLLVNGQAQRLVSATNAERLDWLDRLAGGPENTPALLTTLEQALETLGGSRHLLTEAAAWYAKQGLATATAITVADAAAAFLAEYEAHHPLATVSPIRSTLRALTAAHGKSPLLDLDHEMLGKFVRRGEVENRTIQNRIAHLTTFFNRGVELGWWPAGRKAPSLSIKRPRTPDKAPQILLPPQGKALLLAVREHKPLALPYLVIAGWLGCRPSECLRLDWSDFDWKNKLLHVRWDVAGKTYRERWVPMRPDVINILKPLSKASGRVCRPRSREMITTMALSRGVVPEWPADVLRHAYITFRLNEGIPIDQVAEESGNSPSIIRANYRRPVPPGFGKQWFSALKTLSGADSSARASSRNRSSGPGS